MCLCGAYWVDGIPTATEQQTTHLADVVTAHLAARLEEAKADIGERMLLEAMDGDFMVGAGRGIDNDGENVGLSQARTSEVAYWARDWMLRFVGDALGLSVPSEALGGAVEGRTGRDGASMQGERVEGTL